MKKFLAISALVMVITGCDNNQSYKPEQSSKPTIAAMIASGTEEKTGQCTKGNVSLNCEFLSGDLLGSGKWHHAKLSISKDGDVSLSIDNEAFYQSDTNTKFYDGRKTTTFKFKGLKHSIAEVDIINSNEGSQLSLSAWNDKDEKYMIADKSLSN
ncbi:hypothetical protein NI479_004990 [Salmonella enterica]|nr:hypothetical protein [Salmonella enterica]EJJ4347742.1 hypothetical protein [Salmonella enterica]